ncbi:acid protease [Delitschia confertaspora ATCC 74209]|uniref:Acid protease n=1 Tax=Delitschia confertaspora ATCC 74209 TaxID=1513339 RepID=A0A9P4JG37_9PLEO|nr:acid protease [Delitschia confertaspora ATCC 74209]
MHSSPYSSIQCTFLAIMTVVSGAASTSKPTPYVVPTSQSFDGNDGSWSTFKLSVGSPGQDFRALVSTKGGETYVIVPEGCFPEDGAHCSSQRGANQFQSANSPGFQLNRSSTWSTIGQFSLDLEKKLNYTGQGIYGYDKVALGPASDSSSLSLDHQVVAGVAEMDYYMGYIPLGIQASSFSSLSQPIDSLLMQLWNQSKIPSLSYSYTAGAKYRLKSVFGSLILGGYDSSRFLPNVNSFTFSFANEASKILTVGVQSIVGMNTLKGTFSLTSSAHYSVVDSTVPHLWLPRAVCDNFETAFGLNYDPKTDLYLINSTIREQLASLNPSLTFKLANSLSETGTNYTNIVLPYAALDLQASYPIYPNTTNYFPIRRAANDTQYVLGRTLLQEAYLTVDYERFNFSIAQAVFPDPFPSPHIVAIESRLSPLTTNTGPDRGLGTGGIAGMVVGGALLLILLIAGALFLQRKQKSRRGKQGFSDTHLSELGVTTSLHDKAQDPQELGGTPLTEIASPITEYDMDRIQFLSQQRRLHELPTPVSPRSWRGNLPYFEMDGESTIASQAQGGNKLETSQSVQLNDI